MEISWVIAGKGAGSAEADSVEGAMEALTATLRASYGPDGPETLAKVLTDVLGPLRHAMLTEGNRTVAGGAPWSGHSAGLLVTLTP